MEDDACDAYDDDGDGDDGDHVLHQKYNFRSSLI